MPPGVSINSAPFPSIFAITLLSPFTIHHLVIDEIPPGSHLIHIPDLQTESHKDNHQEWSLLLPFDKEPPTVHLGGRLPPVPRSQSNNRGRTFCRAGRTLELILGNDDQTESTKSNHKFVIAS